MRYELLGAFNSLTDSHKDALAYVNTHMKVNFQFPNGFSLKVPSNVCCNVQCTFNSLTDSHGIIQILSSTMI